jgi:hypothetical protein
MTAAPARDPHWEQMDSGFEGSTCSPRTLPARRCFEGFEVVLDAFAMACSHTPPEGSPMTADLDTTFRYELAEIIERGIWVYRPILSHLATATFRSNFARAIHGHKGPLQPWTDQIAPSRLPPLHGTDKLTAGQVALLGGTRPRRILHSVVHDLGVLLDGGDKQSLKHAEVILEPTCDVLQSIVDHHVVTPAKGRDASVRKLGVLVDLGMAAQIASTLGALHHHLQYPEEGSAGTDLVKRYFLGMVQVFGGIKLVRNDQRVFRDHFIDGGNIDDLVEDDGRDLDREVELRHGFLTRLARALKAQIKLVTGRPLPDPPDAELPATRKPTMLPGRW